MPSYSIGFCVARTRNGGSSTCVSPSIETWRSCIASSSAACVFGGARLISSARRMFVKTGPALNSNVASRWFQTDAPVTSDGQQVGRELDAGEAEPRDRGERPCGERLGETGDVLEEHVAVGEHAREDELQPVALSDDGPLDLVEHCARVPGELAQLHSGRSRSSTTRSISASGSPGAARSSGAGRPGRTSSQTDGPSSSRARSGRRSRSTPRRSSLPAAIALSDRPQAEMDVERRARGERDLALDALEGRGAGPGRRHGGERSVERRSPPRHTPPEALERRAEDEREHDDEPDVRDHGRPVRGRRSGTRLAQKVAATATAIVLSTRVMRPPRARSASLAAAAAASSRWTSSSVSIASSFISGRTSCPEKRAHANSAVSRPAERRDSATSATMRSRYSSGASAGAAWKPRRGEGALHPRIRSDHRAAGVALRTQVVERRREHVCECLLGGRRERLSRRPTAARGEPPGTEGEERERRHAQRQARPRTPARSRQTARPRRSPRSRPRRRAA